jgi:hypothetical protein
MIVVPIDTKNFNGAHDATNLHFNSNHIRVHRSMPLIVMAFYYFGQQGLTIYLPLAEFFPMPLLLRFGACFACVAIIVDHKQRTARSVVGWDEQNKTKP